LIPEIGSSCRHQSDEYPVPKSRYIQAHDPLEDLDGAREIAHRARLGDLDDHSLGFDARVIDHDQQVFDQAWVEKLLSGEVTLSDRRLPPALWRASEQLSADLREPSTDRHDDPPR
jgi:hypothetical protein